MTAEAFRACLEQVAADDGVDSVLAVTVPTAISDLTAAVAAAAVSKPLAAAPLGQAECVRLLPAVAAGESQGKAPGLAGEVSGAPALAVVPAYAYPEDAARALGHAARYQAWRGRQDSQVPELNGLHAEAARELIADFLGRHHTGGWLPAAQACELLACYHIPMITTLSATSEEEAQHAAAQLGGRVVLKAEARGVVHKSNAGAVRLDLRTPQEVSEAYRDLAARFGTGLRRVLVQPMLSGGVEAMAGVVQEPVFGPLVVFGLGGVATDVLGDHSARLTPLTQADADDLISELRAAPLLLGRRGSPPADTAALADLLLRVSRLADDLPEVAELDLNPVIAGPDGACAVDVRVRVVPAEHRDPFLRQLR